MSIFETMRRWLITCPHLQEFTGGHVDWLDNTAGSYGIMPAGSTVIRQTRDILGGRTVYRQYNVVLYARGWTADDVVRLENTTFLDDFAQWVEEQQALGLAPVLGDDPQAEEITAQNGMLFTLDPNGQTGVYQLQVGAVYVKKYGG